MRFLIIEDEAALADTLADVLSAIPGSSADIASDGPEGLWMASKGIYDALILDVMLPGLDGFEVLRQLRGQGNSTPVLMLTARSGLEDRVRGLDEGADYYLTKPFENEELLACLRSILRRPAGMLPDTLTFGDLSLTPGALKLSCRELEVRLGARETELLRLLIQNRGHYLSKDTLILKIWGYDGEVSDNNVEAYISFLRRKFRLLKSHVKITAARGVGYRLEEDHA